MDDLGREKDDLDDALEDLEHALDELERCVASGRSAAWLTHAERGWLNREIVERFELAFFGGRVHVAGELCDPGLLHHNPPADVPPTLEGVRVALEEYVRAFPDIRVVELDVTADAHSAASHWTVTGTHLRALFGLQPTGRSVRVEGMNRYRLRDGRITEMRTQFDRLDMLRQLDQEPNDTRFASGRRPRSGERATDPAADDPWY